MYNSRVGLTPGELVIAKKLKKTAAKRRAVLSEVIPKHLLTEDELAWLNETDLESDQ